MVETAERVYKSSKHRQEDIKVSGSLFPLLHSKEDFSNLNQFACQLGWANLWKKALKKPLQLCSSLATMFEIAKLVEALRPEQPPPACEPGVKQKYTWERGQLG